MLTIALALLAQQLVAPSAESLQSTPTPGARQVLPSWICDFNEIGAGRFVGEYEFLALEPRASIESDLETIAQRLEVEPAQLARWIGDCAPAQVPAHVRLKRSDANHESLLLDAEQALELERVIVLGDFREQLAVVEWDVEVAQASSIADPRTARLNEGAGVALRLARVAGGRYQLEWIARELEIEPASKIELAPASFGPGWRNGVAFASAGGACVLEPGRTTALSFPGIAGSTLQLELTLEAPRATSPERTSREAARVNIVDLASVLEPPSGFRRAPALPMRVDVDYSESFPEVFREVLSDVRDELEHFASSGNRGLTSERIDTLWNCVRHEDASGLLFLRGEQASELERHLAALAGWQTENRSIALTIASTDLDGRDRRVHERVALSACVGRPSAFVAGRAEEAILDWDVEIAQGARCVDPALAFIDEGTSGELTWRRGANGEPGSVELDLELLALLGPASERLDFDTNTLRGMLATIKSNEPRDSTPVAAMSVEQPPLSATTELPKRAQVRIEGRFPLQREGEVYRAHAKRSTKVLAEAQRVLELEIEVR